MTVTRLILAMGLTLYILVGTQLAESRLEHRFGSYTQYMRKVPMLLPSLRRHLLALRDD
jgi:protein-S-isoprenylcysteine O-methyltransferase Ste14